LGIVVCSSINFYLNSPIAATFKTASNTSIARKRKLDTLDVTTARGLIDALLEAEDVTLDLWPINLHLL
jgi:hypothetical protein